MNFLSIETFVPSGSDYEKSKQLFQELGFKNTWTEGDVSGFEKDGCKFILQNYNEKNFAENLMLIVRVNDINEFQKLLEEKKLVEKFGIRVGKLINQPYGKEINIIDIAGVCWHFVE